MTSAVKMEKSVFLWSGGAIRMMTVGICQMRLVVTQVCMLHKIVNSLNSSWKLLNINF